MPTVARLLVDQLVALGADLAFGVPGESYLAVLDALYDTPALRFVTCRQEGGASFAAEASAKLTGRPGLCFVTRGPGVTNAASGVHTAAQDGTPLVVFVGQVARRHLGREAFQELDLGAVFGSMAKWVTQLDRADRTAEVVARAWSVALAGRPGPVVVGLPEDVLTEPAGGPVVAAADVPRPMPSLSDAEQLRALVSAAVRPLVIAGAGRWSARARRGLGAWASDAGVPVVAAWRRQDVVDGDLPCAAGHLGLGADPELVALVRDADVVVAIADRLDDPTTQGFTLWPAPEPGVALAHASPEPAEIGRVYRPVLGLVSSPDGVVDTLATIPAAPKWRAWGERARARELAWRTPPTTTDAIDQPALMAHLRAALPDDAVVTTGAGNFTRPLHRSFTWRRPRTQLAPASGAMGYAIPAALAAALVSPATPVVAVTGDGDLLMTSQELATAAHHRLSFTVLVVDNGVYGTIRTHQERHYPGRPFATELTNPDLVAFARSFGAWAQRARTTDEAIALVDDALGRDGLRVVVLETA